MNTYYIYLNNGDRVKIQGSSYNIDTNKGCLYILNDKKWKIGIFFLSEVSGFSIDFFDISFTDLARSEIDDGK